MGSIPKEPHIAVLAFPFGTHAAPMLTLTHKLALAAPHATFSFFGTEKSNESVFKSKTFDNIKPYNIDDGVPDDFVFTGNPRAFIDFFLKATPANFERGFDLAISETKKEITCVISDAFFYFSADLAEKIGVPWIALWTAAPVSVSIHFYTDLIRRKIQLGPDGLAGRENEKVDFIPGISECCLKDLQEGIIVGDLKSPFSCMLHEMGQALPRAAAVTINTVEELDPAIIDDLKSKFQKCLTLGPFTLASQSSPQPDPNGCLSWLDEQKPASVVYLSFGTVTTPPPNELQELAEGLEGSGVPFLWSLKDKANLPNGFLERTEARGLVVPWTPQPQVLQHEAVGVFVTHCGWNSISEGITGGVPMLCRPFFGDQRLNGLMVSDVWRIGLRIEGGKFTKDETMKALNSLLSEKRFREKAITLKELMKEAIGTEGSSTKNFKSLLEIVVPSSK